MKNDWQPIGRGNDLYFEAIEVASFAGVLAPVALLLQQAAAGNADVIKTATGKESIRY